MLDSNKLSYTAYNDYRKESVKDFEDGSSGPLLLGTNKETGQKYLVKHTYPHNAANEFVCCTLANKIGVAAPRAYLLSPNKAFSSKYAVAIEFLDDLKVVNKEKLTPQKKEDLCRACAFQSAFAQSDKISFSEWADRIVTYDFSETFTMDGMSFLLNLLKTMPEAAQEFLGRYLHAFKERMAKEFDFATFLEAEFDIEPDTTLDIINDMKKRLSGITDSDIDEICNELDLMYPPEISLYYEFAIQTVRDYWRDIVETKP